MLKILSVVLLITSTNGGTLPDGFKSSEFGARIVGGAEASITEAPWQVSLLYSKLGIFTFACGGSIIKDNTILTAAHCVQQTLPSNWVARAGSARFDTGGTVVDIYRHLVHYYYTTSGYDFNIALQFTASPFVLNGNTIATVGLPLQSQNAPNGTLALLTGWGATSEGGPVVRTLHKASLPILYQPDCVVLHGSVITFRMMCAGDFENGGQGPCYGDSGSPLVVDGVVQGVASFGNVCNLTKSTGVFVRVAEFRNWIDDNTKVIL